MQPAWLTGGLNNEQDAVGTFPKHPGRLHHNIVFCCSAIAIVMGLLPVAGMAEKPLRPAGPSQTTYHNPSSVPEHLTVAGDTLFFVADDGLHGRELWRYDSIGQSVMAGDIRPGPDSSNPRQLTDAQGWLYFVAEAEEKRTRLWGWDKEQQQIRMVDEGQARPDGISYRLKGMGGGALYFFLLFSNGNIELRTLAPGAWESESVTFIVPEDPNRFINGIAAGNGMFYYLAGYGFWCADRQRKEKTALAQVYCPTDGGESWTVLGKRVLFVGAASTDTGSELWISDGTTEGTKLVKDIFLGKSSSLIAGLFTQGDTAYFQASDGKSGRELWQTNGTPEGTTLVKDINPGEPSSEPHEFRSLGREVFFFANDGLHSVELWKSNGSEQGTTLVCDLYPGVQGSTPWSSVVFQERLFFCATSPEYGEEIWSIGPEDQSPRLLKDIVAGASDAGPDNLVVFSDKLFFTCNDQIHGEELWLSDGSEAGTLLAADVSVLAENPSSSPTLLTACGSFLYFVADDPIHGRELWMSDGTEEGTQLVCDVAPGREDSVPDHLTASGQRLFFTAEQPATGRELWLTDPLTKSTALVCDIRPGPLGSNPYCLTTRADTLFFLANDAAGRFKPWRSDGTEAGTWPVQGTDLAIGAAIKTLFTFEHHVYFYTAEHNHGISLWRITQDGRQASAIWLIPPEYHIWDPLRLPAHTSSPFSGCTENISPEEAYLIPAVFPAPKGLGIATTWTSMHATRDAITYFVANTDAYGAELWQTDGTVTGTRLVCDAFPGPGSSSPSAIVTCDDTIYFVAESSQEGRVLWRLSSREPVATVVRPISGSVPWPSVQPREMASLPGILIVLAPHPKANGTSLLGHIRNTPDNSFGLMESLGLSRLSNLRQLISVGKRVFFTADDGVHGEELWVTDTSQNSTQLVKDIFPEP